MTLRELLDDLVTRVDFDDAFIDALEKAFVATPPEEAWDAIHGAFAEQDKKSREQKDCTMRINQALATRKGYIEAIKPLNALRKARRVPLTDTKKEVP